MTIINGRVRKTEVMKLAERQKVLLESANDWIQCRYPEANLIGVAWWFFDCGCMTGMGFSLEAGIVTPTVRIDRELLEDGAAPQCGRCSEHKSTDLDKTFTFGIAWFRPVPDSERRNRIKKDLFGPLLDKESVEMYQQDELHTTH